MFDRFAICAAYLALENDWNVGGQLRERPSNRRRRESVAVQLQRMGYRDGGRDGHSWETLKDDAERDVYVGALVRFGMARMLSPNDPTHAGIIMFARETFDPSWLLTHLGHLFPDSYYLQHGWRRTLLGDQCVWESPSGRIGRACIQLRQ